MRKKIAGFPSAVCPLAATGRAEVFGLNELGDQKDLAMGRILALELADLLLLQFGHLGEGSQGCCHVIDVIGYLVGFNRVKSSRFSRAERSKRSSRFRKSEVGFRSQIRKVKKVRFRKSERSIKSIKKEGQNSIE